MNEKKKEQEKRFILFCRPFASQQQFLPNISSWPLYAGCLWKEPTFICWLWKSATSAIGWWFITSWHGVWLLLLLALICRILNGFIADMISCQLWPPALFVCEGFPVIMVSTSLSIAIGKGGIQSYTSDK